MIYSGERAGRISGWIGFRKKMLRREILIAVSFWVRTGIKQIAPKGTLMDTSTRK